MAFVEVLFSTGNSRGFTDGMPMEVKGQGVLVTPAELIDWFQNSTVPASVQALEPNIRARIKRDVLRTKYLSTATAVQAATVRYGLNYTNGSAETKARMEAEAQRAIDQAVTDKAAYLVDGYDTNWRPEQLKTAGVLPADLPVNLVADLLRVQDDTSRHPMEPRKRLRKRRFRVPYENLAPAQMVLNLRDPDVRVDVQRQITPFTAAQIKEAL
jgi:hypothetical protein